MSNGPNIIKIRAWDLKNTIEGLETERQNRIVIERDVLPIIFIPGIMGSRLKNTGGKVVWDPDDKWFMFKTYGVRKATAEFKKSMLIGEGEFNPDHLQVLDDDAIQTKRIADPGGIDKTRKERGWGGVSWSTYGDILKVLQKRLWDETVSLFYEFPVHAFGYNWTASNDLAGKKLVEEIDRIIKLYKDKGRHCEKVLLVTHSMGGLVARSAYMLHGAKDKIMGIIHGVQPSNGSPAAYWRMKAGFERPHSIPETTLMHWFKNPVKTLKFKKDSAVNSVVGTATSWTLGTDGEEVTALLANMPGGLELLPNKQYRNNDGSTQWLELIDDQGIRKALPKSDPYREIYEQDDVYYRLVNPEWLDPGKKEQAIQSGLKKPTSSWNLYLGYLNQAESFHERLTDKELHPETYQFYSSGIASSDRVVFNIVDDNIWETFKRKAGILKDEILEYIKSSVKGAPVAAVLGMTLSNTVTGPLKAATLIKDGGRVVSKLTILDMNYFINKGGYRDRVDQSDKPAKGSGLRMVTLQLPDGAGDGTVPESSGMALKLNSDKKRTFCIADKREFEAKAIEKNSRLKPKNTPDFDEGYFDRGHEPIYKTKTAQFITYTCIENICRKEIKNLLGK